MLQLQENLGGAVSTGALLKRLRRLGLVAGKTQGKGKGAGGGGSKKSRVTVPLPVLRSLWEEHGSKVGLTSISTSWTYVSDYAGVLHERRHTFDTRRWENECIASLAG